MRKSPDTDEQISGGGALFKGNKWITSNKYTEDKSDKQALRRFLWAAQLKFELDADKLLMNCKICANFV